MQTAAVRITNQSHPIRRIREAFKYTPEAWGLREFQTSAGFAELVGRAPSSIRNVECGQTKKWDRLAKQIERITGVSAAWMLGNPKLSDPILDVDGKPWDPAKHLDYLGGAGSNIDWRLLIMACPRGVVRLATRFVEMKLTKDFLGDEGSKGNPSTDFLSDLTKLLEQHQFVLDKPLADLVMESLIDEANQDLVDLVRMVIKSLRAD